VVHAGEQNNGLSFLWNIACRRKMSVEAEHGRKLGRKHGRSNRIFCQVIIKTHYAVAKICWQAYRI
jgi:hypothetical protein